MLITDETAPPQDGNRKVGALTVAVLVHVVLAVLFALIVVIPKLKDEPEIVAEVVSKSRTDQPKMEKKTVMKQVKQSASASAASPVARMLRAQTTAQIAAPEVTKVSDGPIGLGVGDFGEGFGAGNGSGGGMGAGATLFGSRGGGPLVGRLYDMKQDPDRNPQTYDPSPGAFFSRVNTAVQRDFAESTLKDFYQAKNRLGFTYLAIPYMSADEGPKAFQAEKEIEPRGWFVHYSGHVTAPERGKWRFLGSFDDCLMVIVNGKLVLDASWDDSTRDPSIREETQIPRFIMPKPIYAGAWVELGGSFAIDIVVGERPGGYLGGVLLVEKQGENYDTHGNGTPKLPVFSTVRLGADDEKRLKDTGYDFASTTPVFASAGGMR